MATAATATAANAKTATAAVSFGEGFSAESVGSLEQFQKKLSAAGLARWGKIDQDAVDRSKENVLETMSLSREQVIARAQTLISDALEGKRFSGRSEFVKQMRKTLGFPAQGEFGDKYDLKNLGSDARLSMIFDMQMTRASAEIKAEKDRQSGADILFPAQELVRIASVKEPRDWPARWRAAGGQFYGNGRMAALKDDPIWRRISAFGEPTPPFDYGSQMGLSDIDAGEAVELGLISKEDAQAAIASFGRVQEQERGTGDGAAGETRPSPLQNLSEKEIEALIADLSAKPIGDTVAGVKKGAEMSFDEAVKAKPPVNEYNPRDPGTTENCGYCVVANDFRRDGFNVIARRAGSFPESFDNKIFRATLRGHTPDYAESFTPNVARLLYGITNPEEIFHATREEVLAADFGEKLAPGRYYVSIKTYPSAGHAFTFDKLKNGKLKFFDPQTGAVWADWFPKEYADKLNAGSYARPVTFFRVDNKKMTKLAEMLVTTP